MDKGSLGTLLEKTWPLKLPTCVLWTRNQWTSLHCLATAYICSSTSLQDCLYNL